MASKTNTQVLIRDHTLQIRDLERLLEETRAAVDVRTAQIADLESRVAALTLIVKGMGAPAPASLTVDVHEV